MVQTEVNGAETKDEATLETNSPEVGTSNTVMRLWESRSSDDSLVWLTEPPEVKTRETPVSESPKYAITLLHSDVNKTNDQNQLNTIIMRGPELGKFLEDTIPNISANYNESEHGFVLRSPFRALFWYLDRIETAAKGPDKKLAEVTTLLRDVLKEEFRDLLAKRKELLATQEMNFKTLWTLFKPGLTCLTSYEGYTVAVRVTSIEYKINPSGPPLYMIYYNMLGWDGEHLGWEEAHANIVEFGGRKKIKDLDIFPIEFSSVPDIVDKLTSRGRKFVETVVKEPYMMSFSGQALDRERSAMWWQDEQKKKMFQRVVLDARAYGHYHRRIYVSKFMPREEMYRALEKKESDQDIFLYCCTEFHVFALQRKKWARVWIDDLAEVAFNESAYSSLVLPNDYKQLLLAFAEAQIDGIGFDDVIAGKGQGILMLLAGPPGTGKTLTAEAMAEHMKRPMYSVSAGELGATTGSMESELDKVLELSTRWNAVLLLDEADVFMEKRTDNDIQRNTVVSVFLKKLEYYRGVMFLTTNRIGSFDEAFKSRVHVAIRYPDLDAKSRRIIWQNFLQKTKDTHEYGMEVTEADIDLLSQKNLNGREIRNIIKSSQLLASRSKEPIGKSHLDTVWRVEHEESPWQ